MLASWIVTGSCEAVARFGYLVGIVTGLYADIVIVLLIALAPALSDINRPARLYRISGLKGSLWILVLVWLWGGFHAGRGQVACYATSTAIGAAIVVGVLLLLGLLTAANQIGQRSVR